MQTIFIEEFSTFRSCSSQYHSVTPCDTHLNHFEPEDETFTSPNDYRVTTSQISLCGYHHNHRRLHSCKAAVNCTTGFGIRTSDSRTKTNAIPDNINIPALQPATE